MRRALGIVVLGAMAASLSCEGLAGERIAVKGTYSGLDKSQVLELSKTHTIISVMNEGLGYVLEGSGAATPMQYAAGPCGGVMEIKDGKGSGSGYCVRTNPSGGKWLLKWELNPDLSKGVTGKWEMTGIEGNAMGWKGGGTWGPIVNIAPGKYVNQFVGQLEQP
jgi:hypothetical protein